MFSQAMSHLGRGKFDNFTAFAERGYCGHGARKCSFPATCVGIYFAFKDLLRCSDDRTLPLVEKICDSMGFVG